MPKFGPDGNNKLIAMKRILGFLPVALLSVGLAAQEPVVRTFYTAADIDGHGQKMAYVAILALDPDAGLSFDGSRLKVRTKAALSDQDLLTALNSTNTGVYQLGPLPVRMGVGGTMPVRMDTGDPAGDDARYAAAKAAWIVAHPDAYEQMIAPSLSPTAQPQKQH